MTYHEIIECLYDLRDTEKVIFKEKKFGIVANNSLGIYQQREKIRMSDYPRSEYRNSAG